MTEDTNPTEGAPEVPVAAPEVEPVSPEKTEELATEVPATEEKAA